MIFKKIPLLLYLSILSICDSTLFAQNYCDSKYDHIWIMGGIDIDTTEDIFGGSEINFNTSPPSLNKHPKYYRQIAQNTSICSRSGEFLFYSNGCLVLNALDLEMENGDSLNPGELYEELCPDYGYIGYQNMFVLPSSYNDSIYYLFHVDLRDNLQPEPVFSLIPEYLYCTTIDMGGDSGLGEVKDKNRVVLRDTTMIGSSVTAVKHANGMDWWIIIPKRWSASYNNVLVSEEGAEFLGEQYIGTIPDSNSAGGQTKFSPDGSMYAWYHPRNGLYLYDFDRQEGLLSNFRLIEIPYFSGISGGLEFSPSSRFLYVNNDTTLYQLDMFAPDIQESLTHIADYDHFVDVLPTPFFKIERTPDHRIFMSLLFGTKWLHVIQEPDKKGVECLFEQHSLKLPTINNFTLPHFPNYRLGPLGEPLCDSIWVSTEYPETEFDTKYIIGPNPTSGYINIFPSEDIFDDDFEATIFDLSGSLLLKSNQRKIDLLDFPPGVYICRITDNTGYTQISKVVTVR